VATLYHWRRWLEEPRSRHLYPAAALGLSAVLTYLPVAVLGLVMLAWALMAGQMRHLVDRRTIVVGTIALIPLGAWALVAARWSPSHGAVGLLLGDYPFWKPAAWAFYLQRLPMLVSTPLLAALAVAAFVWFSASRFRRELTLYIVWFAVCYAWFSAISVKEPRYALLLVPPSVCLGVAGVTAGVQQFFRAAHRTAALLTPIVLVALLIAHVALAPSVVVPRVSGFEAILTFLRTAAPAERVFYEGAYSGVFSFYLRAQDSQFTRSVVLGSKLLYATRIEPRFGLAQFARTSEEVVALLQNRCGCRLLVVERQLDPTVTLVEPAHLLRQVLTRSPFRLVRSFPFAAPYVTHVDIYEQLGPIAYPDTVELPFPVLGQGVTYEAKPIRPVR
jgi:hypothetical protein